MQHQRRSLRWNAATPIGDHQSIQGTVHFGLPAGPAAQLPAWRQQPFQVALTHHGFTAGQVPHHSVAGRLREGTPQLQAIAAAQQADATATCQGRGRQKPRRAKRLQMVIGNLVQDGLGGDDNEVVIYDQHGRHPLPRDSKDRVARAVVAHLARALHASPAT